MKDKYIPGSGPLGAQIMVLHESPSLKEVSAGRLLENPDVASVLREAGLNIRNCFQSFVSKYYVPPNPKKGRKIPFEVRAKKYHESDTFMSEQVDDLQKEVNQLKPNLILALGGTALWALTGRSGKKNGITQNRGSILLGMGVKCIATYNPAQLSWQSETSPEFIGYWNRAIMVCDIKRAIAQSQFREIIRPHRILEVAKSYEHFRSFYERYKDNYLVSVDIESGGNCVPICVGLAFNKTHGMTLPLWNTNGISTIPDIELVHCWILLAHILETHGIIGQNFRGYDTDKLRMLGFRTRKLIHDVMMKVYAINPELPVGLAFNTSVYTEEPFYKDDGMYHGSINDLLMGCARDSCVTYEVHENTESDLIEIGQKKFYENFLMKLPDVYNDIQNQGFRIDTTERDMLLRKYIEWDEKCRYELFKLTGTEINVSSPKQIEILLFENYKLPRKPGTGEEYITELLNSPKVKDTTHRRVLELILENRRVKKSIQTYMMALPDYDGRMRTTYFLCLNTGRTSTGQQDPPIRPEIEVVDENGKKKEKVIGTAFQTMTKHGDVGADIRGMYVPDTHHIEFIYDKPILVEEEEVFIQADSAQAEARVIFLLADDEQALIDIDNRDYHALTASWFFGGTEDDYSKKKLGYEHPIRFVGKTLRHAGHLGAGKKRAAIAVNTDARKFKIPIIVTEAITERALIIFHTKQPRIQKVFQFQVIECLKRDKSLTAGLPYGIDSNVGGRRVFYERWGEELFRQAFSYIPQRSISDNTKAALIRIKEYIPSIKCVMESHDGLLFSIPLSKVPEYSGIIKREMERPIDFSNCSLPRRELSIPCEIEIGKNYRDLSKFKDVPIIGEMPTVRQQSVTEKFSIIDLPRDTRKDNDIYYHTVEKKVNRSFYVD
jgi:DNA polymerase I-like protein with 3'-5' exonuclease and polymerase domains/uracil-DNA glycosylase